jgi:transposase
MKAIHGGKAKNDRIDAGKIAALLCGGNFPMAYVYPRAMRETRDLLRRRTFFVRQKAQLIAHSPGRLFSPVYGAFRAAVLGPPFTAGNPGKTIG